MVRLLALLLPALLLLPATASAESYAGAGVMEQLYDCAFTGFFVTCTYCTQPTAVQVERDAAGSGIILTRIATAPSVAVPDRVIGTPPPTGACLDHLAPLASHHFDVCQDNPYRLLDCHDSSNRFGAFLRISHDLSFDGRLGAATIEGQLTAIA